MIVLLLIAVAFLAHSNGANDNVKGVASLFGSRTCGYRTAIGWATAATLLGSLAALFLAQALLKKFSGKGLVPDVLIATPQFVLAVACAMALGGLLSGRKVANTMSHKITGMDSGQGFAANLSTAVLVTTASLHGLPVSTTHVSVGSLIGMGAVTGRVKWRPVLGVLTSWIITLPCAALFAGLTYWTVS